MADSAPTSDPTRASGDAAEEGEEEEKYDRTTIPFVIDIINVYDPEMIRKINNHADVDRIHGVATEDKPWWMKVYFPVTRFLDREDKMFVPLTSRSDEGYAGRRKYVEDKVKNGVDEEDVKKIAHLLHTKAPQEELERAVVNAVNRRFYGKDVPEDIVESAGKTADKLSDAITSLYLPALKHQHKVLDFIKGQDQRRLGGCPFADFSHHIGAAVQLLTPSCQYLHAEKDRTKPILDIFTQDDMPMTVQTPRIALRDTTIDGMFEKPAKGKWTVFILQIRHAAAKTKDPLFTFGAGVDDRQCAFKFAFQQLMGDLQTELRVLEEAQQLTDANFAAPVVSNSEEQQGAGRGPPMA